MHDFTVKEITDDNRIVDEWDFKKLSQAKKFASELSRKSDNEVIIDEYVDGSRSTVWWYWIAVNGKVIKK